MLNEDFDWNKDTLEAVEPVSGASEIFTLEDIRRAMRQVKNGKAAGPSGVSADMLKMCGDVGIEWVRDLCNAVVKEGKIPGDWRKSLMVSEYKGKGVSH